MQTALRTVSANGSIILCPFDSSNTQALWREFGKNNVLVNLEMEEQRKHKNCSWAFISQRLLFLNCGQSNGL